MQFANTTLVAIRDAGLPLPANPRGMKDPVREIAVYIRDDLGMPNCQVIQLHGTMPPEWAVVFSEKITKLS